MRFFKAYFLVFIFLSSCGSSPCDTTSQPDRFWESLPVSVSATADFDEDFIFDTIEMFNKFSGIEAFEINSEDQKITIQFSDIEDDTMLGVTTTAHLSDSLIQYAVIEINDKISDGDLQSVLLHELGHALGKKTHDNGGLMYCYSIGSDYTDDEWASLFAKLNEWISEIYPEY